MNRLNYLLVVTIIILAAGVSFCAEPDPDQLMGTVTIGSNLKPDGKGRRELAAIAANIMKIKEAGTVRLRGNFTGATDNEDDYLFKSMSMAREVEQQLVPLLKNRFQVYAMTSKSSIWDIASPNRVEVFFYPRELRVVEMESLRIKSLQRQELPRVTVVPDKRLHEAVPQGSGTVGSKVGRAEPDNLSRDSKKMKNRQGGEDPVLANELVKRAKARAAKRAKRLEQEASQ